MKSKLSLLLSSLLLAGSTFSSEKQDYFMILGEGYQGLESKGHIPRALNPASYRSGFGFSSDLMYGTDQTKVVVHFAGNPSNPKTDWVEFNYFPAMMRDIKKAYKIDDSNAQGIDHVGVRFASTEASITPERLNDILSLKPKVLRLYNAHFQKQADYSSVLTNPNFKNLEAIEIYAGVYLDEFLSTPEFIKRVTVFDVAYQGIVDPYSLVLLKNAPNLREVYLFISNPPTAQNLTAAFQGKHLCGFAVQTGLDPEVAAGLLTGESLKDLRLGTLRLFPTQEDKDADVFFSALARHSNLERLAIGLFGYNAHFMQKFNEFLASSKLKHLSILAEGELEDVKEGPKHFEWAMIVDGLAKMGTLQSLTHKGTAISGDHNYRTTFNDADLKALMPVFQSNKGIKKIDLQWQTLTDDGLTILPDALAGLKLESLKLSRYVDSGIAPTSQPDYNVLKKLQEFLTGQENLSYFDFSGYYIMWPWISNFLKSFQVSRWNSDTSTRSKVILDFSYSDFGRIDAAHAFEESIVSDKLFPDRLGHITILANNTNLDKNYTLNDFGGNQFKLKIIADERAETVKRPIQWKKDDQGQNTNSVSNLTVGAQKKTGLFGWGTKIGL